MTLTNNIKESPVATIDQLFNRCLKRGNVNNGVLNLEALEDYEDRILREENYILLATKNQFHHLAESIVLHMASLQYDNEVSEKDIKLKLFEESGFKQGHEFLYQYAFYFRGHRITVKPYWGERSILFPENLNRNKPNYQTITVIYDT